MHMLAFLVLALIVAARSTAGRVSLGRVSRALLPRVLLIVERARVHIRSYFAPSSIQSGPRSLRCLQNSLTRWRLIVAMHPAALTQNLRSMLRRGSQTGLRRGSGSCSHRFLELIGCTALLSRGDATAYQRTAELLRGL
mmetsp:Transcript_36229/g.85079  ORF Transcript_36229/g.85079 Transcript_36229/m.85079 type:complete len:139 (+) Transcript_36229:2-418(+)